MAWGQAGNIIQTNNDSWLSTVLKQKYQVITQVLLMLMSVYNDFSPDFQTSPSCYRISASTDLLSTRLYGIYSDEILFKIHEFSFKTMLHGDAYKPSAIALLLLICSIIHLQYCGHHFGSGKMS